MERNTVSTWSFSWTSDVQDVKCSVLLNLNDMKAVETLEIKALIVLSLLIYLKWPKLILRLKF